ncbi:hypothetical protein C5L38_12925 [Streptomyces sp. WAC00288]|uniref:hypothetical protein n=1 Tax=unclassified Streptomyces TaxID=2593676 RepID=UPI00078866DB|nr:MULTISPECIES: hypothetical protein [unclassified Streptomyces]AVH95867.1 hypothetical protein C5L38_12925 [Streptomyces sp. WAC00288]KYG54530.1 hypothetical protein AWI43_08740 [Streptomyces sp. WAC04657]
MNTNNPEFRAAWSAVPTVAHAETQIRKLEERRRALGDVLTPEQARRKVFDEATAAVRDGAEFPADIGRVAADAYRDALEAESEALGLNAALTSMRYHLDYLRVSGGAETALEALGKRLTEFLDEVKKPAAELNGARSAEEAIAVGGKAPEAWRLLTSMLGTLRNIREAQLDILRPLGDGHRLHQLREKGHFEAAGITPDGVPEDIRRAMTSGVYDVPYLVYLSTLPNVWVPTSFEEMEAEDIVDCGVPDDSVVDYTPHEQIIPKPREPVRHGHERSPDITLK